MAKRRTWFAMTVLLALGVGTTGVALAVEEPTAEWTYEGGAGPGHWAELDPEYALCGSGREQSPIDIPAAATAEPDAGPADYPPSDLVIVNNGHAIQVDFDPGGSLVIDGTAYELAQLHFHSPSEHTVAGEHAAMEMHLVHTSAEGAIVVLGVLMVEGEDNEALDPIWEVMPVEAGAPIAFEGVVIDADDLLPEDRSFITYPGSLTTPPCTEGVTWRVLAHPIELSTGQLAAYRAIHDGTNRPVQPLGERSLQ